MEIRKKGQKRGMWTPKKKAERPDRGRMNCKLRFCAAGVQYGYNMVKLLAFTAVRKHLRGLIMLTTQTTHGIIPLYVGFIILRSSLYRT